MILLDSDFIIDLLRKKQDAVEKYYQLKEELLVTTQLNFFEVLSGVYKKKEIRQNEEKSTLDFFRDLDVLSLDESSIITAVSESIICL